MLVGPGNRVGVVRDAPLDGDLTQRGGLDLRQRLLNDGDRLLAQRIGDPYGDMRSERETFPQVAAEALATLSKVFTQRATAQEDGLDVVLNEIAQARLYGDGRAAAHALGRCGDGGSPRSEPLESPITRNTDYRWVG